jgi:hypothetical protein
MSIPLGQINSKQSCSLCVNFLFPTAVCVSVETQIVQAPVTDCTVGVLIQVLC